MSLSYRCHIVVISLSYRYHITIARSDLFCSYLVLLLMSFRKRLNIATTHAKTWKTYVFTHRYVCMYVHMLVHVCRHVCICMHAYISALKLSITCISSDTSRACNIEMRQCARSKNRNPLTHCISCCVVCLHRFTFVSEVTSVPRQLPLYYTVQCLCCEEGGRW